jgi:hypothetical protein
MLQARAARRATPWTRFKVAASLSTRNRRLGDEAIDLPSGLAESICNLTIRSVHRIAMVTAGDIRLARLKPRAPLRPISHFSWAADLLRSRS